MLRDLVASRELAWRLAVRDISSQYRLAFLGFLWAIILPLAGGFWALVERNRWSTVILGGVCLAIAVMVYRMGQIWFVQGA